MRSKGGPRAQRYTKWERSDLPHGGCGRVATPRQLTTTEGCKGRPLLDEGHEKEMSGKVNKVMSIYQIVIKAVDNFATQYRNIHHYEFFNYVPDGTQLQEFVDNVDAAYKSNLQGDISEDHDIYAYDVRRVDVGNLPSVQYIPTAGAWSGTDTSGELPHQVALLVTFKAETVFPRSSRTYLFGMCEGNNSVNGRASSTVISNAEDWAADMLEIEITGALNADKQAVQYGGDPRAVTDNNDLTTYSVNSIWATQRRRRTGVGI